MNLVSGGHSNLIQTHLLQVAAIFFWTIKFWSGSAGD